MSLVALLGGAGLLVLAALGLALRTGVGAEPPGLADVNFERAPDFSLVTFDGEPFQLSDQGEGPIFLYFWASWCAPCRDEARIIQKLWPEYERRGYTFVGINATDLERDARAFAEEFGLGFPLVHDADSAVYFDYGVRGMPTSFFFRSGLVPEGRLFGPITEERLRALLDSLQSPPGD